MTTQADNEESETVEYTVTVTLAYEDCNDEQPSLIFLDINPPDETSDEYGVSMGIIIEHAFYSFKLFGDVDQAGYFHCTRGHVKGKGDLVTSPSDLVTIALQRLNDICDHVESLGESNLLSGGYYDPLTLFDLTILSTVDIAPVEH